MTRSEQGPGLAPFLVLYDVALTGTLKRLLRRNTILELRKERPHFSGLREKIRGPCGHGPICGVPLRSVHVVVLSFQMVCCYTTPRPRKIPHCEVLTSH